MGNLVFIHDGKAVTDSLMIADVFGKEHKHVLRDIEVQIQKLGEAGETEFSQSNFGLSSYTNERGRTYPKVNLTEDAFTLVVMSYVTPEAMKMKIKFIQEFKRMKEALQNKSTGANERDHLQSVMKLAFYHEEDIKVIKNDIEELKTGFNERLTVDYGQQRAIENAKKARVRYLWENGVINREVHDTLQKVYAAMGRDLKDVFAVNSYRDIRQKDFDESIQYIKAWRPRLV